MKTLDEWNQEMEKRYMGEESNRPKRNGIACPECGVELCDACPMETLTGAIPKKRVICFGCGYAGYRVA